MKPRPRKQVSQDRWLVSYADFITLLFGFFVVLYAFAKADQKKQAQVSESIDTAFHSLGIFPSSSRQSAKNAAGGSEQAVTPMNIVMGEDVLTPAKVKDDLDQVRLELQQTLSNQVAQHTVSIQMGRDGLVISLREAGFFNSGSASPRPDTLPTLHQIAAALSHTPYDMRIEGHTDNVPIHTVEFDSNWELSSARATRIARLFLDMHALPADRLSAAGYAEYHPVASNSAPEGRAQNRRVDLVVLPRTKINFSSPAMPHSTTEWRKITNN
ncbi:MAG: flagellar motor protein MotB [Terracidiphilus sp.]|nr:flagellar motor protein MotB [Terracidiphilus sp.]MDR3776944.1 flagellar motor protein MotB [Terracidiphilus sp.]